MADLVLDTGAFTQFYDLWGEDAGEIVREMIDMFLNEAPAMLAGMEHALEAANARELRRLAHTLKSNAGTLGARRLYDACRQLEALAAEENMDAAQQMYERVRLEYHAAENALREYMETLSGA